MRTLLLAALLLLPALCRADDVCLWLNAATAGGVLGGAVTATISRANTNLSNPATPNAKSSAGPTSANPSNTGYSNKGIDDSECVFTRRPEAAAGELQIEVRTMSEPAKDFGAYAARCGAHATPLKAIGNEATACTLTEKAGPLSEQVVGRVRDRVFVVRLSRNDSLMTQSLLREKARKVAEQVAGNLF